MPAARVQLGDLTNAGTEAQSLAGVAWMESFSDAAPGYIIVGNHDLWDGRSGGVMAVEFGMPSLNYSVDLGFVRLVMVGPEAPADGADNTTVLLTDDTLKWLDAELQASARQKCIIVAHAPLYGTVLGDVETEHRSDRDGFYITSGPYAQMATNRDLAIREILAHHNNVLAWVSGHTHSSFAADDLLKAEQVGGTTIAAINAGGILALGKGYDDTYDDAIRSMWLTVNVDHSLEVRWRNHGGGCWDGPNAERVWTFSQ